MHTPLVLGFDIGGTSTRALLATITGRRLATARTAGANPTAHGLDTALERIAEAARTALTGHDPAAVTAVHLGIAGGEPLDRVDGRRRLTRVFADLGVTCAPDTGSDLAAAFAAATDAPAGTIAIGGTGAVAARLDHWRLTRRGDGYGWLLGDEGSGFWLGRQAARTALLAVDGHRPMGALARAVLADLSPGEPPRDTRRLVDVLTARHPLELAAYAVLVTAAAADGDPAATALLDTAADLLTGTITSVRDGDDDTPIVLGGSLLTGDTPIAGRVRDALTDRYPHAPIAAADDGAAGAAWLAARHHTDDPAHLHAVLVRGKAAP